MSEPKKPLLTTRFYVAAALLLLLALVYSNHFDNSFHFDDSHAVLDNPWIRDLRNIPRFFTDGGTFSALPSNRSYRPVVTTSLAVDYRLGGGLQPPWFHISTFFWFAILCGCVYVLYRGIGERAGTGPGVWWAAVMAAGLYALHPVEAETVNYIIQRGDLYATLGVVAGLAAYAQAPNWRWTGIYLLPVILGVLSKPPAAVFPALLLLWIWLFDAPRLRTAIFRSLPAFVVTGAAALFTMRMDPPTFVAGAISPANYRFTQPAVLMGYFRKFFLPFDLTADTDHYPFESPWTPEALAGFAFLAAILVTIWWCTRLMELRPIAFGLGWFLIASTPTSLVALAEVENDHRMFLPFVGLSLSVVWAAMLLARRLQIPRPVVAATCAVALAMAAWGAWQRNRVWDTEESLWLDVTRKSPKNGRGLMNYALTQMEKANYGVALDYLNRAAVLNPAYDVLEVNLGVANGAVGNAAQAEAHFNRAIQLAQNDVSPRYFYARWLSEHQRNFEALAQLAVAEKDNPDYIVASHLAMEIHAAEGNATDLKATAERTLARFPSDEVSRNWLGKAATLQPAASPPVTPQPDHLLNASVALYQAQKFEECIAAARAALALRPRSADAWNNIGAAHIALHRYDEGIAAVKKALELQPDFPLAQANLEWAEREKKSLTVRR